MTGLTYLAYMFIQSSCYFIMKIIGLYIPSIPYATIGIYIIQFISALSAIFIGVYIGKKKKGFDFVPDKQNIKVKIETREIKIFILSAPSLIFVVLMVDLAQKYWQYFFLMPMIYAVLLYAYLYLAYKKDRMHNEFIS